MRKSADYDTGDKDFTGVRRRRALAGRGSECRGECSRNESDPVAGQHHGGLHPWQRPLGAPSCGFQRDAADLRRLGTHIERLCLLGVLRGDFRPSDGVQGVLVEPRLTQHSILPLRQLRSARIPYILALRPERLPFHDKVPQRRADQSVGACGRGRAEFGRNHLGGLRLYAGPVFRFAVLEPRFARALRAQGAASAEHARALCGERFRRQSP